MLVARRCAVRRTGPSSRAGACGAQHRTDTDVRTMSDADATSYLNKTAVPVIDIESFRTQLLELSRSPHQPK